MPRIYGPLNTYQAIEKAVKTTIQSLWDPGVMEIGLEIQQNATIGNINFGDSISGFTKKKY
jgi:hypothetical protein